MKRIFKTNICSIPCSCRLGLLLAIALGGVVFPEMAQSDTVPALLIPPVPPSVLMQSRGALVWDADSKELNTKLGDGTASFVFWFTNTSTADITINSVRASCGCTTAKVAPMPWRIVLGTNSPIEISVDLRGKQGTISKTVTVDTSAGVKTLRFKVNIPVAQAAPQSTQPAAQPESLDPDRLEGIQRAKADRQVVFTDPKCAACHADPAKGQTDGAVLYSGICATCHDSPERAQMVTDLHALKHETDLDYWLHWIEHGRAGSMMPAFGRSAGGPLDRQQIAALASHCVKTFQPKLSPETDPKQRVM